ncbi:MAG: hypothetical protein ACR2M0_11545 [Chloroflexia bacterium]
MKPMEALKDMAVLAAHNQIKGRSFRRNSLLKPLDIILDNLEKEPKDDMRDTVKFGSADQIYEHINRVTPAEYRPGYEKRELKQDQIMQYVELFFDILVARDHRGDVNRLLQRKKLFRSAYLIYFRNALPQKEKANLEQEQAAEAAQQSQVINE